MTEYLVYVTAGGFAENGGEMYNCQHHVVKAEDEREAIKKWVDIVFVKNENDRNPEKIKQRDGMWFHAGYPLTVFELPIARC